MEFQEWIRDVILKSICILQGISRAKFKFVFWYFKMPSVDYVCDLQITK